MGDACVVEKGQAADAPGGRKIRDNPDPLRGKSFGKHGEFRRVVKQPGDLFLKAEPRWGHMGPYGRLNLAGLRRRPDNLTGWIGLCTSLALADTGEPIFHFELLAALFPNPEVVTGIPNLPIRIDRTDTRVTVPVVGIAVNGKKDLALPRHHPLDQLPNDLGLEPGRKYPVVIRVECHDGDDKGILRRRSPGSCRPDPVLKLVCDPPGRRPAGLGVTGVEGSWQQN